MAWIKEIYNSKNEKVKEEQVETIVCSQVFCDNCGDCLACYGNDECFHGPYHRWVEYED